MLMMSLLTPGLWYVPSRNRGGGTRFQQDLLVTGEFHVA
jgi:hypothetical protein